MPVLTHSARRGDPCSTPWRCVATTVGLLLVLAAAAVAQTPTPGAQPRAPGEQPRELGEFQDFDELNLEDLLDVTVSIASGRVQRVEEAPSIVSVVTDEDIRRMGAHTLEDVLRTVPGFDVLTDNSGRLRLAVRGVATTGYSENVLILFNGHRMNDAVNGGATTVSIEIPLYNIKQIEIIRGPGSALFGTDAFFGVVNLVPYTAQTFRGAEVSTTVGSFATQRYSAMGSRAGSTWGVFGSVQFDDRDGAEQTVPADSQTALDTLFGQFGIPPISLAPRVTDDRRRGVDMALNANLRGFTVNARYRDQLAGGFVGPIDVFGTLNQFDSAHLLVDGRQKFTLSPDASLTATVSFTQVNLREHLSATPPGFGRRPGGSGSNIFVDGTIIDYANNTRRAGAEVRLDVQSSAKNQVTFGAGFENEWTFDLDASANFNPVTGRVLPSIQELPFTIVKDATRRIYSVYALDTLNVNAAVGLTGGLRVDHYNDFGTSVSPRAGVVWRLPRGMNVKALYGRAFRAPSFTELYTQLPAGVVGNPDADPSIIHTIEGAVGYRGRNRRLTVTYFANLIRDFLERTQPTTPALLGGQSSYTNTSGLDVQGVEIEGSWSFGFDHAIFGNYAWVRPEVRSTDTRLPGTASHLATVGGTVGLGRYVSVTGTLVARGERPRAGNDTRAPVDGYVVTNLNVRLRQLFNRVELSGILNNAFDVQYFDPSGFGGVPGDYPRPGRQALLRASFSF